MAWERGYAQPSGIGRAWQSSAKPERCGWEPARLAAALRNCLNKQTRRLDKSLLRFL